jgi:hypothetical protein
MVGPPPLRSRPHQHSVCSINQIPIRRSVRVIWLYKDLVRTIVQAKLDFGFGTEATDSSITSNRSIRFLF